VTCLNFYGLALEPCSNAPVARFHDSSAQHAQALMRLTPAVSQMKGLALLVGDIGPRSDSIPRDPGKTQESGS
jgi:type II secretory pathway predicted ATPase ExeA